MSWEDDDFEPAPLTSNKSWDDEDVEEPPAPVVQTSTATTSAPKPASKKNAAKQKIAAKETTSKPTPQVDETQKRQDDQQKVEESDFQNAKEIFAGVSELSLTGELKDEKSFEELATQLAKQLGQQEKHYYYKTFLKSLFKQLTTPLTVEEIKEIASALTVLANEKMKAEKPGKKKKVAPKKALNVKSEYDDFDIGGGGADYDDYDDFM